MTLGLRFCSIFGDPKSLGKLSHAIPLHSAISKPFADKLHWSVLFRKIALIYVTSIGISIAHLLYTTSTGYNCSAFFRIGDQTISFTVMIVLVAYSPIVPSIIIFPTYFLAARALKVNTMKHDNNRAMQLRNKQNAKIVRMFIVIVLVFLLLTMPNAICNIYNSYLL